MACPPDPPHIAFPDPCPVRLLAWVDSQSLAITLWVGLALFTVAFVIVMRTRWGNAKTVAKCVWLSVFAHLLLGGLAYGTKLFFPVLPTTTYETVSIQLVIDPLTDPTEEDPQPEPPATSDVVPAESPSPPSSSEPELAESENETTEPSASESSQLAEEIIAADELQESWPINEVLSEAAEPATSAALDESAEELDASRNVAEPPQEIVSSEAALANQVAAELASSASPAPSASDPPAPQPTTLSDLLPLPNQLENASNPTFVVPAPGATVDPAAAAASAMLVVEAAAPRFTPPVLYSLRDPENRFRQAVARGGSRESEQAVNAALQWLAARQKPDGHWDANESGAGRETYVLGHDRQGAGRNADTALTGLALLAFLGAGHTPQSGEYRDVVSRGLTYLVGAQDPSGHLAGRASLFAHMYSHGIATFAVSEALAMTGDPALRPCVQAAVAYSIQAQDPQTGSWRYRPHEPGDMSQFGWQIMALKSAELGGVPVPRETWERANHFVELCASGPQRGVSSYRPGHPPSETMTAESLLCRCFLRQTVPPAVVEEASRYIVSARPGTGEVNYYLWYYGTMALHQAASADWTRWNDALQQTLVRSQIANGAEHGSWPANGKWSGYGGPIYSTAMAALSLEVYYRYLPLVNIRTASR